MDLKIYLWALLASGLAVGIETLLRRGSFGSYLSLFPYVALPALLLNYMLFKLQQSSQSLLGAFVVFSFCNIVLRILVSLLVFKEKVQVGVWVAVGLVVLAQVVKFVI